MTDIDISNSHYYIELSNRNTVISLEILVFLLSKTVVDGYNYFVVLMITGSNIIEYGSSRIEYVTLV